MIKPDKTASKNCRFLCAYRKNEIYVILFRKSFPTRCHEPFPHQKIAVNKIDAISEYFKSFMSRSRFPDFF